MNESFSYFPYFFYFFLFPFLYFTFFFHFSLFFFPLPSSSSRCVSSFFFSSLLPSSFFLLCRCLAPRARPIHCRPFCPQHIHCCRQPPASAALPRADLHRSCLVPVWTFVHPHYPPTRPRPRHVIPRFGRSHARARAAVILAHDVMIAFALAQATADKPLFLYVKLRVAFILAHDAADESKG
jgi:hypothetical protein